MSYAFYALCLICLSQSQVQWPQRALPANWHGVWSGQLTVHTIKGKSFERSMEIAIAPIKDSNSLTWRITSTFENKKSVRNYELVPDAEKPGLFKIDEKNGIVIDARMMGNALYSYYKDGDILITAKYERRGESLHVELASVLLKEPRVSEIKSAMIEILSYQLGSVHTGELKKVQE